MISNASVEAADRAQARSFALGSAALLDGIRASIAAHADRAGISMRAAQTMLMNGVKP